MKKLVLFFLLAVPSFAQIVVVGGDPNITLFPGVPTGACIMPNLAQNQATGYLYRCFLGAWTLETGIGGGGGGGITNSAGSNVIAKSDGTNVIASSMTDNAGTVTGAASFRVNAGGFIGSADTGSPRFTFGNSLATFTGALTTTGAITAPSLSLSAGATISSADTGSPTFTFSANRITANQSIFGNLTGNVTGNASTATQLASNGTNCAAGNYPLGVDAAGNAEGCTIAAGTGTVTVNLSGSLTNTAIVTGAAGTALQTPSATSTLDSSGNMALAGTLTTSGTSGVVPNTAGTGSLGATNIPFQYVYFSGASGTPASNYFLLSGTASGVDTINFPGSNTYVPIATQTLTFTGYTAARTYTLPDSNATLVYNGVRKWSCQPGLGDGLNSIPAGTYLESICYNDTGATITLSGIKCFTDNNGSSTLNAVGNTLGSLLTGAVTCTNSFATGTQSANVALTAGDYIKFTWVMDGSTKQLSAVVTGIY